MKNIIKIFILSVIIVLCVTGCVGTTSKMVMDWSNLHRVGPNTVAKVYYWEEKEQAWFLSDKPVEIPEGHYIGPPPSVNDE